MNNMNYLCCPDMNNQYQCQPFPMPQPPCCQCYLQPPPQQKKSRKKRKPGKYVPPVTPPDRKAVVYEPCVHLHFKEELVDRECLTREQYVDLLATPKGYRWMGEADCSNTDLEKTVNKTKKKKKCKRMKFEPQMCPEVSPDAGGDFADEFVENMWDVMSPEITCRLIDFLVNEFGMSVEEAEDFIDCKSCIGKQPVCKRKKSKDIISLGPKYKWVKEFSDIFAKRIEQYIVGMLMTRRTPRVKRIAERILDSLCNLTGEKTTLQNPKTKIQKVMVLVADRLALWIEDLLKDIDKPIKKRVTITEEESEEEEKEEEEPEKEGEEKREEAKEKPKKEEPSEEEGAGDQEEVEEKQEEQSVAQEEPAAEEPAKEEVKEEEPQPAAVEEPLAAAEEPPPPPAEEPPPPVEEPPPPVEEPPPPAEEPPAPTEEPPAAAEEPPPPVEEPPAAAEEPPQPAEQEPAPEVAEEEPVTPAAETAVAEEEPSPPEEEATPASVEEGEAAPEEAGAEEAPAEEGEEGAEEEVGAREAPVQEEEEAEEVFEEPAEEKPLEEEKEPEEIFSEAEKRPYGDILDLVKEDIAGIPKDRRTERQQMVKGVVDKRMRKMMDGREMDVTQDELDDAASRVAHWTEHVLGAAKPKPGLVQGKSPGKAFKVQPMTGGTLEIQKLSSGTVARETAKARGVETPPRARKIPGSVSPMDVKSAEEWVDWASNIANVADEWGKWLDGTLTDAERRMADRKNEGADADWKQWRDNTQTEAQKWRVERERIKDEGKLWESKLERNPQDETEREVRTTDME